MSITVAGGLFGFAGMVLGVPVFAILYSVLSRLVSSKLRKRKLPVETADYMGATGRFSEPNGTPPREPDAPYDTSLKKTEA